MHKCCMGKLGGGLGEAVEETNSAYVFMSRVALCKKVLKLEQTC